MDYRRFNLILLGSLFAVCALFAILNYWVDPYGIFKKDLSRQKRAPNEHFIKIRHLLQNPGRYDALLFGASRVGKIDVRRIPDGRAYNLCYSEGLPGHYLKDLQILLAGGLRFKNILIGLDDFSFKVDPVSHLNDPLRHPYGNWIENLRFYAGYLLHMPRIKSIKEKMDKGKGPVFYDIYETGMVLHLQEDERIERDRQAHLNHEKFKRPHRYEGDRITDTLNEIDQIKRLCEINHIKLIVFINPIHRTTYLDGDTEQFERFKKGLANITEFYDFSGLNSISVDNYCFYETSHYRYFVGDFIVARIFGDVTVQVPEDFGVFITNANIEVHLDQLRQRQVLNNVVSYSELRRAGLE